MNYAFYLNVEFWRRVVGEERFRRNVGHVCAHCALEALGGNAWYIILNEPVRNIRQQQEDCGTGGESLLDVASTPAPG